MTTTATHHDVGPRTTWLPVAAVSVTLTFWASAFVAIRHLGEDFSPGALALGRMLVATIALAPFALRFGRPRPTARQWPYIVMIGVLWYAVYMVALNEGERRIDAGTAAMLIQVAPVLIALLAAVFLSEPFTRSLALGLALAFAGVALIATSGSQAADRDALGVALCLLSATAYAISVVLQKPLMRSLRAIHITWLGCGVGTIACLPFAGELVREVQSAPASSVWWVVYLGVFPTALAFTTYSYALTHMSAGSLGVSTYLVPPITIVMGLVVLGEVPPTLAYAGGAITLVGVAVARRSTRPPAAEPVSGVQPHR